MKVSEGTVAITGASRGIGHATTRAILLRGGRVVAIAIDRKRLEELQALAPDRISIVATDLGDPDTLRGVVASVLSACDGIDGLVNCAGIATHQGLGEITNAAIDAQLRVNVVAPLLLAQGFAPHLSVRGGAIVNVSSTLAVRAAPGTSVYAATKAALNAITRTLALELAPSGVRVNAVLPGVVDTDMSRAPRLRPGEPVLEGAARKARIDAQLEALRSLHPLGRLGTPADVADVIVGLLDHPWQTGSLVTIDGGLSIA